MLLAVKGGFLCPDLLGVSTARECGVAVWTCPGTGSFVLDAQCSSGFRYD